MNRRLIVASLGALLLAASINGQELRRFGFLGLQVAEVPDAERQQLGLAAGSGVKVLKLVDGGSGQGSGIEPGDVIAKIDGLDVGGRDAFVGYARHLHAGDSATLALFRAGKARTARLKVKPRPFESSPDADVSYRAVDAGGSLRRVIVTIPKKPGPHPAVLYITGIGCFSQESLDRSLMDAKLLYGLTQAGFVTMRVEKSGMGDSEGPPCATAAADLHNEVNGYLAGLRELKRYPFVDSANVFLLGLSIGGVEAPIVARQEPVRGVIVVNTVAKPFLEYLLETRRRQMQLRGAPYDERDRHIRLEELCNHRLLIERQTAEQVLKATPECREAIDYPAPASYMQQWAAINPAEEWKQVTVPVMVVYGASDYIATSADAPYLTAMLNSFHPGQATLKPIAGMDHYMTKVASMEDSMKRAATAPFEFNSEVLDAISAWLHATMGT